ncbi:unnamed protein product [Prunus armeniaca]
MTALTLELCCTLMADSFDTLPDSLLSSAKPSPHSGGVAKQALYSIAQCTAVLCLAAGDQQCSSIVKALTEILKDDSSTNSVLHEILVGVGSSFSTGLIGGSFPHGEDCSLEFKNMNDISKSPILSDKYYSIRNE